MKSKFVRRTKDITAGMRQNADACEQLVTTVQAALDKIPEEEIDVREDAIDMEFLVLGLQASMNDLRAIADNLEKLVE